MADIFQNFDTDLTLSANGDILMTQNVDQETTQRVLRRLLTSPGADLWSLSYGAGLGGFVGLPASPSRIQAVVLRQMKLEAGVSQTPAPTVNVSATATGTFVVSIQYTDAFTGQSVLLTLPIGR